MGLQTVALESGLSELEATPSLAFRDNPAETFFDKGFQSCVFALDQLACLFKEAIGYM